MTNQAGTTGQAGGTTRAALVTGCSSGIGRATVLALRRAGWSVYATARRVATIADLAGDGVVVLRLDVTDEASMSSVVSTIESVHGSVDLLVNNAGYALQGTMEETPLTDIRAIFETNAIGLARLTQLVLPGMRAAGSGRIVTVGSMGGRLTFPGGGFYHATKYALEAMSDALRLEVRDFGVRVVLVQPGPVRTSFAATALGSLDVREGPYAEFREQLAVRFASTYNEGVGGLLPADRVARVIVRAASARRPRPRYAVGSIARALMGLRRILPDRAWDAFVRSIFPVPHRNR